MAVTGRTVLDSWDAGLLGCGELMVKLAGRLSRLPPGGLFRLVSLDPGAMEDIPAWCRLTGHVLVASEPPEYLIERRKDP